MKLLHLSDLHITDGGLPIWDTDTKSHFERAVEIIRDMEDVNGIILTGDISDDGSQWSYEFVDNMLAPLDIHVIACPGNHDDIDFVKNKLEAKCLDFSSVIKLSELKILNLNSAIPNMAKGLLSEESLSLIQKELSDGMQTIICFHHPPIEPGGWLNRKLLVNRNDLNILLSGFDNVPLVLFGHIHYPMQIKIGKILYSSAPSIGFAFDKDLPKFEIAKGKEGFNIIDMAASHVSITRCNLFD